MFFAKIKRYNSIIFNKLRLCFIKILNLYIKSKDNLLTMNKKSKIKLLMKSLFVQFGQAKCDNGVVLLWDEDTELIVGYTVYVEHENEDGEMEYIAPEDGEYTSGNTVFTIESGVCTKIENKEVAEPVNEEPAQETLETQAAEETPENEPEPEPEFNAEQAIAGMRAEYDAKISELTDTVNALREQVETLLALPAEENAFQKENNEETKNKPIFKSRK